MRSLTVATALILLSGEAFSQTANVQQSDVTRGITLPPTSAATVDNVTALSVNPGALSAAGALQLLYSHERAVTRDQVGDGLYAGGSAFGFVGYGASVEWMRSPSLVDTRKTALGLSLGNRILSLGATWNFFSSRESFFVDRLSTWDAGLSLRPLRQFSLGFTVRNLDEPHFGPINIARTYDTAVAVRPFGERYSLAVDWLQNEKQALSQGRLTYTLNAEVIRGIWLSAGASHGWSAGQPFQAQVAATFNLEHFGFTYGLGGASKGLDHVFLARLSADSYRSISFPEGKVALIDLPSLLARSSSPALQLLGRRPSDPFVRLIRLLDRAQRDPELKGVLIKIDTLEDVGLAKADELRNTLLRLRSAGKHVLAVMLAGGDAEYLVAAAAEQVYVVPQATLAINGFSADVTFLGEAMDRLGVHWDVAKVGAYKNAPDQLIRKGFSPEQKEALTALLQNDTATYERSLKQMRNLSAERLREGQEVGLIPPAQAQKLGLVDDVVTPSQLEDRIHQRMPHLSFEDSYRPDDENRPARWGFKKRVAIIPIVGTIVGGKSREDPFGLTESAGAETIIQALDSASSDPLVEAIVLRVDSGGGDGLASDLMYRAVLDAKKKKPVVASMGDAAASGGYYVAMGADAIYASPTTVTGSIGVFVLKPSLQGLGEKLGIYHESIQTNPSANFLSLWRRWTDAQKQSAQNWANAFYDDFITEVAARRNLSKDAVDGIARGRVWSGTDAKERKLVDAFGGLWDAVEDARKRAGITDNTDVDWEIYGGAAGLLPSIGAPGLAIDLPSGFASVDPTWRLAKELGVSPSVLMDTGVKALPEFTVKIR